jgi:negative regulator of flagellin synthesis FlgM
MTHKIDAGAPPRPPEPRSSNSVHRAGSDRADAVAAATPADSLRLTSEASDLQALHREMGAQPAGIDMAKVNRIRDAIADGSYHVDAQEVANRLLALERELGQ